MGSPDLPGNEDDRRRQFQPPPSNELPMHGLDPADRQQPADDGDAQQPGQEQDDDANSTSNPYTAEGYHPLSFEPMAFDDDDDDDDDGDDDDESDEDVDESNTGRLDEMSITEEDDVGPSK